jgi:hypothetical protein
MQPSFHGNQHQFTSSAGAVSMVQQQFHPQHQIVAIHQCHQNRNIQQANCQHRIPLPSTTMTTGRLIALDDKALNLIRNAHRLGIRLHFHLLHYHQHLLLF